ncbi:cysteine--tRNA ligase [Candidatus Saccharibacteria bacterium]|nr:cysteine--tRNA ligase [Candidatus Saccharibacteria bacterium]
MKLYNTLGKKLEDFKPAKADSVSLYTCGPTVYDYAHIGNWRSFVFDDILRRTLEQSGYKVRHVMNITDVGHLTSDADEGEDKLEAGAQREGKSVWDVARHYTEAFLRAVKALNILPPNGYSGPAGPYARATDFIDDQIDIIKLLLEKGFAYQTEQAIYFDISKLLSYGELSAQKLEDKSTAARGEVVTDKNKHHPHDFALWFFTVGRFRGHDMKWPSPWGEGFPGWHLECSAIIHATLRDPLDIHTGGVDHIGTHHPNEMAQTEAAFGHKLANYWLHNEFVMVDGQKMAKSLGNFITLDDITGKRYNPLALRLLYLQAHYRSRMNFTWDSLSAAAEFLKRLQAWADLKFQPSLGHKKDAARAYGVALSKIEKAMQDDLNSPLALAELSRLTSLAEKEGVDAAGQQALLDELDRLLGLDLAGRKDIGEEEKAMISARERARGDKNWQHADDLRQALQKKGIELNDTPHGPVWSRL